MDEVIIFQHINFQGIHHHIFTEGDSDLRRTAFNDKTSSAVVVSGKWDFYQHINFGGTKYATLGPGLYSDVRQHNIVNDAVSSVKLNSTSTSAKIDEIVIFEHINFTGIHHHIFTQDQDLRRSGFNDKTSSVLVKSGIWEFYRDIRFEGPDYNILGPGMYGNVRQHNIVNDAVSSLDLISVSSKLNSNEISLFERLNFTGKHHHIFTQDKDLRRSGMNNKVSSVVVDSGNWVFYGSINFDGKKYDMLGPGLYSDVRDYDIINDAVSSVRQE